jgi:hypothetical protein
MHTDHVGQVGNLPTLEKPPFHRRQVAEFQSAAGYQPALQISGFGAR